MKRIIGFLTVVTMLFLLCSCNNTTSPKITLNMIAEKVNSCDTVLQNKEKGTAINAKAESDKIIVSIASEGFDTKEVIFYLNGNVLSADISMIDSLPAMIIVDCVGQLHGYSDGETFSTLNSDEFKNYTLDKEGVEMTDIDDKLSTIKIDITKKIPLVDMSEEFIEVSDLQSKKQFLFDGGTFQWGKGNVMFFCRDEQEAPWEDSTSFTKLSVGETKELTISSYKSLLSILEVMFDNKGVADYFKSQYPGFSEGNKEFEGFEIEINPVSDEWEETTLGNKYTEFVRVTIDKEQVKSIDSID